METVKLFKSILNERFAYKRIEVSQSEGIVASDLTSSQTIQLSKLSSGEQHELVVMYDLLFTVETGSLILIDEPELSLHVSWQREFISDLLEIRKLRNLQFIVATHSPQVIDDYWNLVQELTYDG